jgi:TatD DNase family protein
MRYHARMIDSHCHLADRAFDVDRAQVVERARQAGVRKMLCIADTIEESENCRKAAEQFDGVYWTVGVHPHAASTFDADSDSKRIHAALKHNACKAVGEIGLDYHYMNSPKDVQQDVFETQLALAKEADVFFPGGFGTFDELFGVLTLIQTDKIPHVPIILFGSEYWKPLEEFLRNFTADRYHAIERRDLSIFEITDSVDRVIEVIKKSPVSEWWRVIN